MIDICRVFMEGNVNEVIKLLRHYFLNATLLWQIIGVKIVYRRWWLCHYKGDGGWFHT